MYQREIKNKERPVCNICQKPLVWQATVLPTIATEVYGWYFNCDCVDEAVLKPDVSEEVV